MRVSIWDLDYYYAKNKINCFNPDVMKISSYHKQLGDEVNFVTSEVDIKRPYDLFYIVRENPNTPGPPAYMFLSSYHIKWWGKGFRGRINWKMSDAMLACRPDYLLYPERNTREERSEQVRLFNNNAELLPLVQDWSNTFRNKYVIVTDPCMWFADKKSIISALKTLQGVSKVSFLEPIWIQKIIYDKEIKEEFFKLNFVSGSQLTWTTINLKQIDAALNFIDEFKESFPSVSAGQLIIDYKDKKRSHWEDRNNALEDFNTLKKVIIRCKKEGYNIKIKMPISRFETPYFFLFEELSNWTAHSFKSSWLEYLSKRNHVRSNRYVSYWSSPSEWSDVFRDLLRQTWEDKEFLLTKWKGTSISVNEVPWKIWEEEFKYGI